jgi:hypothetical protein
MERAARVLGEAKFLMWMHVPFIVLHFGDYPTPRYLLEKNDRSLREILGQLRQTRPVSPPQFSSVGEKLLELTAFRIVVLEGIRQKYFSLKSNFYSHLYPALVDIVRTLIDAPALSPSDYVTILLSDLVTFEGPLFDKLETLAEQAFSAEKQLIEKAEQWGLDWKSLIGARWDSGFGTQRGCSRFPFLPNLICDLWSLFAPYYGVGLAVNKPITTRRLCGHISAIIRESMPKLGERIDEQVVKDIMTYRYDQSVGEGERVANPGLYTCFFCGETTFLNAGQTAPCCGSHNLSGQASRLWLRNEKQIFRMREARRRPRS